MTDRKMGPFFAACLCFALVTVLCPCADGAVRVFTDTGQNNEVWINDGTGGLMLGAELVSNGSSSAAIGDLNGDGVPDLFLTNKGNADKVYFNYYPLPPEPEPVIPAGGGGGCFMEALRSAETIKPR